MFLTCIVSMVNNWVTLIWVSLIILLITESTEWQLSGSSSSIPILYIYVTGRPCELETLGETLFVCLCFHPAMDKQPVQLFLFFFPSCFYLIVSGLLYWLVLLPQSVNNDLAAAAAGCCCQAFDKHSCRSHITPWLASFHWLPVK